MKNFLLYQYDLHYRLYHNVLDGFTDEETNKRLHGDTNMNHVKYLAGHVLHSHYGLGLLAGLDPKVKWENLFAVMGQSKAMDNISYPPIEEIRLEWTRIYEPVRNVLEELTDVSLSQQPPAPFDIVGGSVGDVWAFINHHTAYHIGQIGILKRGFGKEPMSYAMDGASVGSDH